MPISEDPEKRERQLANLSPEAGKLGGRPKGSKNWSTIVQELLTDEVLFTNLTENLQNKPPWLEKTGTKTLIQAVTIAQTLKAMGGSHFSAEWLRKTGWGDKVDITSGGERLRLEPVIVSNIKPRSVIDAQVVEPEQIEEGRVEDGTSPQA
jgi:hypothetical protein